MKKFLPLYFAVLLAACNVLDKPEPIPSYLSINNFTLTTDSGTEGENTQNISDAWVYMDDILLGVFELPALVPILDDGTHDFEIRPGIKSNGISETRRIYPFYKPFTQTLTLYRDSTVNLSPSTVYYDDVVFTPDPEDFESAGQVIIKDALSDTGWVVTSTGGITGQYGKIVLDASQSYAYFRTDDNHNYPKFGERIYLEIDIKSNNKVLIGIIDESSSTSTKVYNSFNLNATNQNGFAQWRKVYIDLTDLLSFESQATQHEFFIEVVKDQNVSTAEVCLDNIKIVHF